jgi:hypothetical protein
MLQNLTEIYYGENRIQHTGKYTFYFNEVYWKSLMWKKVERKFLKISCREISYQL